MTVGGAEMERNALDTERLVWTVEEVGRLLGISRAHAYELVAGGDSAFAARPSGRGTEARDRDPARERPHGIVSEAGIGLTVVGGSGDPGLLVTSRSASMRRELGPVAWSALELLALRAEHTAEVVSS